MINLLLNQEDKSISHHFWRLQFVLSDFTQILDEIFGLIGIHRD